MNLILLESSEIEHPLARTDPRAIHIIEVLRRQTGDEFDVGVVDGPKGKAVLDEINETEIVLSYTWGQAEPELDPVTLIVGLSRPQTNRKVLRAAGAMGIARIAFPLTERGEASYPSSRLWTTGEYRQQLLRGVEQAFSTRVPAVAYGMDLEEAISKPTDPTKLALDNYEGERPLHAVPLPKRQPVTIVVGSERGWTAKEREVLRHHGYELTSMGERVLRTETAVVSALAIVKAHAGMWG